jgi:predicted secreted acid phosphatase
MREAPIYIVPRRMSQTSAAMVLSALLTALGPATATFADDDCPAAREPRLPPIEEPAVNIDKHKKQLRAYHAGNYNDDIELVFQDALAYVERQRENVKWPAIVLDIDETSLSNWPNIDADDFGFIKSGMCSLKSTFPCGFDAWILKGRAPKIDATLVFFNAVRAKHIAVFFVTGRRDSQRAVTIRNLRRAGFKGWTGLRTRPDDDNEKSIVGFKSGERARIERDGYEIIASIGDQQSDLDGGHLKCPFKVPNPYYFIP